MSADQTDAIRALLVEAEEAHGVYETMTLNGVYDQDWPRWYTGYLVDHGIGDLVGVPVSGEGVARQLDDGFAEYQRLEPKPVESWADHLARKIAAEAVAM